MHTLFLFTLASLSINLIPGPDVIYIVSNTMTGQSKRGVQAALGLSVGYLLHTIAAVLGLSALVLSSSILFSIIKYVGAAYLLYLGISSIIRISKGKSQINISSNSKSISGYKIFSQGLIVSLLNPKVALFFLSFLPQFLDLSKSNVTIQLMVFGLIFTIFATLCNMTYALLGNVVFLNPRFRNYTRLLEGLSGFVFIGLGVKVGLNNQ